MILTILKVVGIILLVILILIILILALVLLVPIRYRFSAEYFENPDVLAVVKYAPVGLNAQVTFKENGLQYTIRALGGVVMTNTGVRLSWLGRKIAGGNDSEGIGTGGNDSEGIGTGGNDSDGNGPGGVNNDMAANSYADVGIDDNGYNNDIEEIKKYGTDGIEKQEAAADIKDISIESTDTAGAMDVADSVDTAGAMDTEDKDERDTNKKHKPKKIKKEKDNRPLSSKIDEKVEMIKKKYADIKQKLSKLNKKKDSLIKVYKSKRFDKAKEDVIRYIKEILMAIKPQHVEGRVHFGLDDPATTGEILGGLATVLPLYDGFLDIRPDFERQVIEGLLKGYGKIRLWSFARIALKVLFNKNLMMVVKRVKTIAEA
ncbi:MAG: DUF2953 domain-containing protein [Lachnospiraceae bacterium]|nr:DUF2953 domain-containing protein [Lachnospiraceae bacterium]